MFPFRFHLNQMWTLSPYARLKYASLQELLVTGAQKIIRFIPNVL